MSNAFKPNLSFKSLLLKLTMAVLILFAGPALAQDLKITGKVLDEKGQTIPGASVIVKGKTTGAATDVNGAFSIKVAKGDVLVVSYIGYKPTEQKISSSSPIEFVLELDNTKIDEVVVIGYGTIKKSDLTGSVASVKKEDLLKRATTNPVEALQGRVSGVNIQKVGGNAGAATSMKIRGVTTFGSNEPLYIIDGFPGSLSSVNPSDIENMEILKDGAAAAIYGSVAANGVVIVSTKNGKKGNIKVDINSYLSISKIDNQLDMLDAEGYKKVNQMMYEAANKALPKYITTNTGINSNWQKEVFRDGFTQNHSVSVIGGQENLNFALTSNYSDEKGIMIGNQYGQKGTRLKVGLKKSMLELDANMWYRDTKSRQPNYSIKEVYMLSPLIPVYDPSNEFGYGLAGGDTDLPNNRNVVADNHFQTSWKKGQNFNGNISAALNLTNWLQLKSSYSFKNTNTEYFYHRPKYIADPKSVNEYPFYSENRTYWEEQIIDNLISINKAIGDHSINALIGTSITKQKSNWNTISVEGKATENTVVNGAIVPKDKPAGFLDPYFMSIDAGLGGTYSGSGSNYIYNRFSYFGRINYSFKSRYLLQATLRRDGSSKFGADSRWGTFPSVAFGWRISEEEFFPKNTLINNLKFRASWGRLGNESPLKYYDFQAKIYSGNNLWYGYVQGSGANPWAGSIAEDLANRALKWETTDTKNIGFDYGFFGNKVTGVINYFEKKTIDMLVKKVLAPSAGLNDPILNVGEFSNSGIEFEIGYNDKFNDFSYNIGANVTYLKNKVLKLSEPNQILEGVGLKFETEHIPNQTRQGQELAAFYLYKTDGIFQSMEEVNAHRNSKGELLQENAKPGDIRFKDINGDGVIDPNDKVNCGNGIPKIEANINFSGSYKGIDLSFLIGSAWGHKLYNGNRYLYEAMSAPSNFLASSLNAWTPQNKNTNVPRAVLDDPNQNAGKESDRFLEKGDFIRLRQLQLGYTLPQNILSKVNIEKLRLYISGDNLLTWTKYSGIDPEFASSGVLNTGVDNLIYPFTKSYTVGIQITF